MEDNKVIAYGKLSDEEFNALMERANTQYENGEATPIEDFMEELSDILK